MFVAQQKAFDAKRSFHLVSVEAKSALLAATEGMGYGLISEGECTSDRS
jgi:hypothetical protein